MSPLCFSEAKEGGWRKRREGNESTVKGETGAGVRRRTTCSARPSIRLKSSSITDCVNKELRNKSGFICLHRPTPQMLIVNELLSLFLNVYIFALDSNSRLRTRPTF